jgi:hypothetical protein
VQSFSTENTLIVNAVCSKSGKFLSLPRIFSETQVLMNKPTRNNHKPLFKPQDRYYVNEQGWWFFTVDKINGPFKNKADCVDACRLYIQRRDGVLP